MARLKSPDHIQQIGPGYCLPACAQMALNQLDHIVTQAELAHLMETLAGYGTPFSRINRLVSWQIDVQIGEWGGIETVSEALVNESAVIAAVLTNAGLPGWGDIQTQHTVLIVEVTSNQIMYHDPALSYGPVTASSEAFLLAWNEMAELAAFCKRA